ncbi:hypothetical protein [Azospirillum sp. SYSU D00513]|uniref:hypothetical protein n=1 Tax=Azospirillum sp. SYSU D00513 TaxID=2812561 RepID=UPI001A97A8EE|nr:hypothetical protein [Azospirillum sp. SYSU D00513]
MLKLVGHVLYWVCCVIAGLWIIGAVILSTAASGPEQAILFISSGLALGVLTWLVGRLCRDWFIGERDEPA